VERPGEMTRYNQTGYVLLGMVIEKVIGTSCEEFIGKRLLKPLHMAHTTYGDARDVVPGRASMYSVFEPSPDRHFFAHDEKLSPENLYTSAHFAYPRFAFGGAGLNSSIADMIEWELSLGADRALKPSTLKEAAKPYRLNNGKDGGYGLGWEVGARNGHRWMTMNGGNATQFLRFPDDHLCVIVLTNLQGSEPESIAFGIAALYLPGFRGR
jgi:CubicO group peptidase (beta-lactamase class C family)